MIGASENGAASMNFNVGIEPGNRTASMSAYNAHMNARTHALNASLLTTARIDRHTHARTHKPVNAYIQPRLSILQA